MEQMVHFRFHQRRHGIMAPNIPLTSSQRPSSKPSRFISQRLSSSNSCATELPSGKHTNNYGKTHFLMGKSTN